MTFQHQSPRLSITIVTVSLLLVAIGIFLFAKHPAPATTTITPDPSHITIITSDGIKLDATFKSPVRNSLLPAVIFVHDYFHDRHQWDATLQTFIDHGFVVLSYDMRGFGNSRLPSIPASPSAHFASLPADLDAVIGYLHQQPFIDQQHISIIGTGLGANVAYQWSGTGTATTKTIVISPQLSTTLDGGVLLPFTATGTYFVGNQNDAATIKKLSDTISGPKEQTLVTDTTSGSDLLKNSTTQTTLLSWLNQ